MNFIFEEYSLVTPSLAKVVARLFIVQASLFFFWWTEGN
ncbi:hypothetical protein AVDCRST_MAG92-5590 [uncultured Coleofasciculus sp.]|uniref:Uncharacterized protein n=1 Tax=uncultured Coleofasciculus sp. TaxID=1267456 RepID=A0A6J4KKM1_9CYAN|nr:hypothetical protein AVDCRST_MAG92-5590 [uncultured Coleofasciculus sp.]